VAILNEMVKNGLDVTREERKEAFEILKAHIRNHLSRNKHLNLNEESLVTLLRQIETADSREADQLLRSLYAKLKPIYSLSFKGLRQIGRADVKKIHKNTPDEKQSPLDTTELNKISPSTIDSIQGRENKVAMISFVRSNLENNIGFLRLLTGQKRLNVALSRGQVSVALIGSFSTLIEGSRNRKGYSVYQHLLKLISGIYDAYNEMIVEENKKISDPTQHRPLVPWKILSEAPDGMDTDSIPASLEQITPKIEKSEVDSIDGNNIHRLSPTPARAVEPVNAGPYLSAA